MGKRPGFRETIRTVRATLRARGVLMKNFEFTAPVSAHQVIASIERRWGRQLPTGAPRFHVVSAIHEQQVIVAFGNDEHPRIFAARIDFQSRDPTVGTLWFFDAEAYAPGTAYAEDFVAEFAGLLAEISPDADLHEHDGPVTILTTEPDPDWRERRGGHRRG